MCHGLRRFQNAAQGHCGDQRDEHCAGPCSGGALRGSRCSGCHSGGAGGGRGLHGGISAPHPDGCGFLAPDAQGALCQGYFPAVSPQQYSAGQRHHHHHGQAGAAGRSGCGSHCGFLLRRQAVQPVDDAGVRLCAVHSVLYCAKHSRPPAGPCKRGPAGRAADLVGVFAWSGGGLHRSAGAAAPALYHRPGSSQLWLHHAGF